MQAEQSPPPLSAPIPLPPKGLAKQANDGLAESLPPDFPDLPPPRMGGRRVKDLALLLAALAIVAFAAYVVKSGPRTASSAPNLPPVTAP